MSDAPRPDLAEPLRTLAFGSIEGGVWGAGWFPPPGSHGLLVLGADGQVRSVEADLEPEAEGRWRLRGEGASLVVEPIGAPAAYALEGQPPTGVEQLVTVVGEWPGDGGATRVDATGRRGEHANPGKTDGLDSVREVTAWFDGEEAVSVLALRPRKHRGHGQDALSVAMILTEEAAAIEDPRLSTTYAAGGRPARFSVELWSSDPEQFPRRVAGESAGQGISGAAGGWQVMFELLRSHSRGRDGAAVYVLARPDR